MMPRFQVNLVFALAASLLLAVCAQAATADDYVWRNVKVGGGGYIPNVIFSPVEKGLAYLRSDMGGVYRWDEKAQSWIPLQDGNTEPNYRGIESVAPDPVDADVIYAAVGTNRAGPAAMLRSADRGEHWQTVPVPFRMGANEEGRDLGERLAVDPNQTSILYFGSRYDGLQRSTDSGKTWAKVGSFPVKGSHAAPQERPHAGLSFVVFDPKSGGKGKPSRTIFVGVADAGAQHLFRSDDAGKSWKPVAGEPPAELLPGQAEIDAKGMLTITYSNSMGPWAVSGGAVFKLDTHSGKWTDITPEKAANRPPGGYMGLSLDRERTGTLVVASLDRATGDIIWRSTDGGAHWQDIRVLSRRDVSSTPFLLWGHDEADFGWWITGLAIDPFDSSHVGYTTGATVYETKELLNAAEQKPILWTPWVEGVEQTAVLALASPKQGAPLISGFGDIGGFVHFDLAKSMPISEHPLFTNTNTVDVASQAPDVMVRSGTHAAHVTTRTATLGYSLDGGKTWHELFAPLPKGYTELPPDKIPYNHSDPYTDAAITVSADGAIFAVATPEPVVTADRGQSWIKIAGIPEGSRPVPDGVNGKVFYAADFARGTIAISTDGGRTFKAQRTRGLPSDLKADQPHWREMPWPLLANPEKAGDLWYLSQGRVFHSTDGGKTFARIDGGVAVATMDFGKPGSGQTNMTLFAIGSKDGVTAIWRSTDSGQSWVRVNDAAHEYNRALRCIAADKNVFGRVYVGTDGRGIIYGEPRQ